MHSDLEALLHAEFLARGYSEAERRESPASFGSWYRVYGRRGHTVRLVWDGRDGTFVLQEGPAWQDRAHARPAELRSIGVASFLRAAP